nr:reverse transcriptase domain-containing protein [Tanacetum cinerariifolium]
KEGYENIELKYMGGFWVMIVFQDDETKKRWRLRAFHVSGGLEIHLAVSHLDGVLEFEEDGEEGYDVNDESHKDDMYGGVSENLKDVEGESDREEVSKTNFKEVPDKSICTKFIQVLIQFVTKFTVHLGSYVLDNFNSIQVLWNDIELVLSIRRVVPRNYNPKGERFLIASRFPTPLLACAFFSLRATVTSSSKLARDQTSNLNSSANPTLKGRIRRSFKQKVENSHFEENLTPVATMTDNRTMAEMLRAPTEGTIRTITFIGAARRWLEKEPSRSITTWDDLVLKFLNEFFPPSRTTNLRNEILNFQQKFDESFHEAWERYKDLLRACPHHGFTELHQLDTFYNAFNPADQDSLNAAVGGNLLEKSPQDALTIIENKSKNFHLNELEKIKRMNDVSLKAMQNQIDMVKNELINKMKTSIQTSLSNQTNEIKNMMASLLQMNTASTSRSGTLPGNTIANPKGELKAIITRSGLVTDGPTIPNPPKSVNQEEDKCVEETYTNPDHAEYNIKVPPPPPVQKPKLPIQRNFVIHTRDSLPSHIPYPSRTGLSFLL